jgi:hypothetical protein
MDINRARADQWALSAIRVARGDMPPNGALHDHEKAIVIQSICENLAEVPSRCLEAMNPATEPSVLSSSEYIRLARESGTASADSIKPHTAQSFQRLDRGFPFRGIAVLTEEPTYIAMVTLLASEACSSVRDRAACLRNLLEPRTSRMWGAESRDTP